MIIEVTNGSNHAAEVHDDREDVGVMSGDGPVMVAFDNRIAPIVPCTIKATDVSA